MDEQTTKESVLLWCVRRLASVNINDDRTIEELNHLHWLIRMIYRNFQDGSILRVDINFNRCNVPLHERIYNSIKQDQV